MKVSPLNGAGLVNLNEGASADPDRMARAKAIASGQTPDTVQTTTQTDPQVERAQNSIKRLKMRTQVSPDRHVVQEEAPPVAASVEAEAVTDILDTTEQTQAASEATKPLSPQYAAIAKAKRALQLEREQLGKERQELEASKTNDLSGYISKADLKTSPLKILLSEGVTYDQLTEEILATNQESEGVSELKAQIKALEEGFDKKLTERDTQARQQVLGQLRREADQLISQGDDYEMVREAGYAPKVVELIDKIHQKTGEVIDVAEAAALIEQELLEESLKFAKIKKVQSRLNPAPTQQPQPVQQDRPNTKIMKTLTNRDGTSSISMSKRERAIAAMEGRLK